MKKLTLEYIAGFVDGEGHLTISRSIRRGDIPFIAIANSDKQVLQDIKKYFSLSLKLSVRHSKNPKTKTGYCLQVGNIDDCKSIATLLEPHLRIKKEQAQIIMQFPRANQTRSRGKFSPDFSIRSIKQKLRKRIMLLNKRGRPTQGANEDLQPEPDPQLNLLDLNQKEVI